MAETNPLSDQNATPEDVATLYSWANLHGAKYRDFSASRAQTREMARLRAEQAAVEAERQHHKDAEAAQPMEVEGTVEEKLTQETLAQETQARERERDQEHQEARAEEERAAAQRIQEARVEEERAAAAQQAAEEQRAREQRIVEQWAAEQRAEAQRAEEQRAAAARQAERDAAIASERIRRAEWEQQVAAQMAARQAAEEAAQREAQRAEREAADRAARLEAEQAALKAQQVAAEEAARLEAEQAAARVAREAEERAVALAAEKARQLAAEQAEKLAAEQAAAEAQRQSERLAAEQAAIREAEERKAKDAAMRAAEQAAETERHASLLAAQQAAERAAEHAAQQLAQQRAWQRPGDPLSGSAPMPYEPLQGPAQDYASHARAQASRPSMQEWQAPAGHTPVDNTQAAEPRTGAYSPNQEKKGQAPIVPAQEDGVRPESTASRNPWASTETREPASRPAWLNTESEEADSASALPNSTLLSSPLLGETPLPAASLSPLASPAVQLAAAFAKAPGDTLQDSRDRLTSRWFALRGVFDGNMAPIEPMLPPAGLRPPAMAVFSLAGGVGKTSLVATLGRALSARGERVLLVDTAAFGLLPFFYGATDQRPGVLRTFTPPGVSTDAPVQMVTLDPEGMASETPGQESLSGEIARFAQAAGRVIVDLATASGATTRRIMRMAPLVLVPVVPDMNSVVSVSSIDAFFEHNGGEPSNGSHAGKPALPYYVLNQFDASLPLHLDVREVLGEQLGERLLPFALRRAPAMSEALAEGMTVVDYAPGSPLAEDFNALAGWVKSLSAPATTTYRGVRWSEK